MNLSEYIYVTSRPYSSLLQEISISGKLFQSKRLFFNMPMQTQSNWCWAATSNHEGRDESKDIPVATIQARTLAGGIGRLARGSAPTHEYE